MNKYKMMIIKHRLNEDFNRSLVYSDLYNSAIYGFLSAIEKNHTYLNIEVKLEEEDREFKEVKSELEKYIFIKNVCIRKSPLTINGSFLLFIDYEELNLFIEELLKGNE